MFCAPSLVGYILKGLQRSTAVQSVKGSMNDSHRVGCHDHTFPSAIPPQRRVNTTNPLFFFNTNSNYKKILPL